MRANHIRLILDVLNVIFAKPSPECDEQTEQAWQRHAQRLAKLKKEGPGKQEITGANKHTGISK